MKKVFVVFLAFAVLPLAGCNGLAVAQKAQAAIAVALNIAAVEEQAVPAQDQAAYKNFVTLGGTLNGQLGTCISNVSGLIGKNAKFISCFNTFAQGLFSPAELAQFRILSPATQAKVRLYATAVVAGVNILMIALGGAQVAPPAVGAAPASAELFQLESRMRVAAGY